MFSYHVQWAVLVVLMVEVISRPTKRDTSSDDPMTHMQMFGYNSVGNGFGALLDADSALKNSLKTFQKVWGLNETGVLDAPTKTHMNKHRCGNADTALVNRAKGITSVSRRKRFIAAGAWRKKDLTWNITNYRLDVVKLSKDQIDAAFQKVFDVWQSNSALTFTRDTKNPPDFNITFVNRLHAGCPVQFLPPGPGQDIAHAFFPGSQYTGQMHLDISENWLSGSSDPDRFGFDLATAALHEIGHGLGLDHVSDFTAIMNPYYLYRTPLGLFEDDKAGMAFLYSPDLNPGLQSTTTPNPLNSWCFDGKIDAITEIYKDNSGYEYLLFKGDEFAIEAIDGTVTSLYPMKITSQFKEVTKGVDTAAQVGTVYVCQNPTTHKLNNCVQRDLYLTKGSQVYQYDSITLKYKSSGTISSFFKGLPDSLDSMFIQTDGKVYATKGDFLYRYTPYSGLDTGYPAPITSRFSGLRGSTINSAMFMSFVIGQQKPGYTFMFNSDMYDIIIDDGTMDTVHGALRSSGNLYYPQPTINGFFSCRNAPAMVASLTARSNSTGALTSVDSLLDQSAVAKTLYGLIAGSNINMFTANGDAVPKNMVLKPADEFNTIVPNADPLALIAGTGTGSGTQSGNAPASTQSTKSGCEHLQITIPCVVCLFVLYLFV